MSTAVGPSIHNCVSPGAPRWLGVSLAGLFSLVLLGALLIVAEANAQTVTVPGTPGVGALGTMCVTGGATTSTLSFNGPASTCTGAQTNITGMTFNGATPATQNVTITGTGITTGSAASVSVGSTLSVTGNSSLSTLSTSGAATLKS